MASGLLCASINISMLWILTGVTSNRSLKVTLRKTRRSFHLMAITCWWEPTIGGLALSGLFGNSKSFRQMANYIMSTLMSRIAKVSFLSSLWEKIGSRPVMATCFGDDLKVLPFTHGNRRLSRSVLGIIYIVI